ncbi:MAG: arsenate reductase ArsC [Krumholzibacteria bacterium]|nr:arsenate reductase ArsC [Candidatus Krumholzibacteria bacterium]
MKVLFVCTANACRSQMAEAWARVLFPAGWSAASCGLFPHRVSERARWVMQEAGVGMDGQESKSYDQVDLDAFDLIVSLSEEAGRFLPEPGDPRRHRRVPVDDPVTATGTVEEIRDAFRAGRQRIRAIVQDVVDGRLRPDSGDGGGPASP